jgi:hypothetical protein
MKEAEQYSRIILFLDEMNSAAPSVQSAAYQLVLNRKVGTYSLPDNVVIVAAGNREGDKGVTYRMPAPLANRFIHVEMEHKFIDKIFEMGDLENLKAEDLKNFILRRANEKLIEIGYEPIFEYDVESANQLEWFDHLTGGTTHTDFFSTRSTDYSKAGESENWSEDELFN